MTRLTIENLSKEFRTERRAKKSLMRFIINFGRNNSIANCKVLEQLSLTAEPGEFIAIIGKNGSGKSTLLRTLAGIYRQDEGTICVSGKVVPLIELEVGLQGKLTMADNIVLCATLLGLNRQEIIAKMDNIVHFAELEQYAETKIHKFSEGMKERLSFSIAIHCNPEILLLDELFNVADFDFRMKASRELQAMAGRGVTIIFVSHNLDLVRQHADRIIWLEKGKIKRDSDEIERIINEYSGKL